MSLRSSTGIWRERISAEKALKERVSLLLRPADAASQRARPAGGPEWVTSGHADWTAGTVQVTLLRGGIATAQGSSALWPRTGSEQVQQGV